MVIWSLLIGCSEFGIDPIDNTEPPLLLVTIEEQFVQTALPALDVLLVVDDTASMAQEQQALAGAFGELATGLDAVGLDWQLGVVSTTMEGPEAGLLLGSPWVLTPHTPDVAERFVEAVTVGTDGVGPEAGLAAASTALALAASDGPNAGFRRPRAGLHVVFVSDADDASDDELDRPVDDFLDALQAEVDRTGLDAVASAVVGDLPSGCTGPTGTAQAGTRYAEVVQATEGGLVSICTGDLGALLGSLGEVSATYNDTFLLREAPTLGTVSVRVDGARLTEGWAIASEPPALVFDVPPAAGALIDITYLVGGS